MVLTSAEIQVIDEALTVSPHIGLHGLILAMHDPFGHQNSVVLNSLYLAADPLLVLLEFTIKGLVLLFRYVFVISSGGTACLHIWLHMFLDIDAFTGGCNLSQDFHFS